MRITNMCRKMKKEQLAAIGGWGRRLEADECIIHTDGSITLMCEYGCVCSNYRPTAKELYR